MDHLVIDRPESVEVKHLLVPTGDGLHLSIFLVTDTMIDVEELRHWHKAIERLREMVLSVAWQEDTSVSIALDKGVNSVTVGLDAGDDHLSLIVGESGGLLDTGGASGDSFVVDACCIINCERDVLDTVTVLCVVSGELLLVGVERRGEDEGDLVVPDNMGAELS